MKEQFYLFLFKGNKTYEMKCSISLKDAIWEMAKYIGTSSDLLRKSLGGFQNEDVSGIIELYNHFVITWEDEIEKIYIVEKIIYDEQQS